MTNGRMPDNNAATIFTTLPCGKSSVSFRADIFSRHVFNM